METTPQLTAAQAVSMMVMPTLFLVALALFVTQVLRGIARARIGREQVADRSGTRARRMLMTLPALAVMAWILASGEVWFLPPALCLGTTLLLVWVTPGAHDAVLGEAGVQRGWHARRFESLEEWRLAGDHLRFRLFGEWVSVPCPPARQPELRAKLLALVPDRESPFQD